jgi:hypothetical protein
MGVGLSARLRKERKRPTETQDYFIRLPALLVGTDATGVRCISAAFGFGLRASIRLYPACMSAASVSVSAGLVRNKLCGRTL